MARVQIPVTLLNRSPGIKVSAIAQTDGDDSLGNYFASNGGYTWLEIENVDASDWDCGVQVSGNSVDDIVVPDKTITVQAGEVFLMGVFPKPIYNQENLDVYVNPEVGSGSNLKFRAFVAI